MPERAVLVLGSDTRAFLTVVRSLGRRGIEVHAAWGDRASAAARSRYIRRYQDVPTPRSAPEWQSALLDLLRLRPFDLIIPCDDPSLLPVQSIRGDLERYSRVALPSDGALAVAHSKVETWQLSRELRIPVPDGDVVITGSDPDALVARFGLPLVLKPDTSFTTRDLLSKRMVRTLRTRAQVHEAVRDVLPGERFLAQRFFAGAGTGVEFLAHEGSVLFAFQHLRVHEPLTGGGSSYRMSVPLHDGMMQAAAAIVAALRYTGVGMVEFKLGTDGGWSLVEINPRFWGSLPLAVAAGADFPWFLYRLLVEGHRSFPAGYRTGVFARNWVADLHWFRANFRADKSDPALITRPVSRVAGELLNVLRLRERSDTLALDDPLPGIVEMAQLARQAYGRALRGFRQRLAAVRAVRAMRGRRVRRHAARATNILFVCKGNICRSPFAAAYARSRLLNVQSSSAGYLPPDGRESPARAREAAHAFGVDLSSHRSVLLDAGAMHAADIVFVFDNENMARLAQLFPRHKSKVHLLGGVLPTGGVEILDPYGESIEAFDATYTQIAASLDALAERSRGPATTPQPAVRAGT